MCNEFASCYVLLKNTVTYIGLNFKCLERQYIGKYLDLDGDQCPDWVIECSP